MHFAHPLPIAHIKSKEIPAETKLGWKSDEGEGGTLRVIPKCDGIHLRVHTLVERSREIKINNKSRA